MPNFNQDKNQIKNKATDVYKSGKRHASDFYEENKDKAESIKETVKETACNLYDDGKKYCKTAETYVGEATQEVIQTIRNKPVISMLIAGL